MPQLSPTSIDECKSSECTCSLLKFFSEEINCLKNFKNYCSPSVFSKSEKIMRQASMSDYIYFIKEGMVKVHISSPRGKEQIIKIAQTGAFVGLSNLTNTRVNFYSVTAITDATVCVIKKTFIEKLIKENGEFSFHLIKSVCEANIFTTTRLINTIHKQVNGRIADALLYLSETIYEDDEFELNLTRSDLGKFVGISRENFSRVLSQFSSDRIIEIEGKKCKIIDINRLKSISKLG